jgi:small subunit ribosomal protein S18
LPYKSKQHTAVEISRVKCVRLRFFSRRAGGAEQEKTKFNKEFLYMSENNANKEVRRPAKRIPKKKVCVFCVDKIDEVDYKDAGKLKKFVTEKGKIIPKRITGTCAKHQRILAEAIKRARFMVLLPYKGD